MRYCLLALLLAVGLDARAEQPLAASTIVLYNKNVPDSVSLAIFYAEQRGIARDHLVGLECSTEEDDPSAFLDVGDGGRSALSAVRVVATNRCAA